MKADRGKVMEKAIAGWEGVIKRLSGGRDSVLALLKLSCFDPRMAAEHIDCSCCRRHVLLEAGGFGRVAKSIRGARQKEAQARPAG